MRASTAKRIGLWTVAVLGGFTLFLFLAGDEDAVEMLRYVVVIAVTFGLIWWLGYRYRVLPRRDSFAGQARELGLRAEPGDTLGLLDLPFRLFQWSASVREVENTGRGHRGGRDVVVADYWFAPTGAAEYDDYQRFTCVLMPATRWPDLSVVPERIASRVRSALAMPDIETESGEFNQRFEVRSTDRRFALAFLDARMIRWLLEQPPWVGFEILGGRLMLFRPRVTTSVDDVARALELLDLFVEQIPRVVRADKL